MNLFRIDPKYRILRRDVKHCENPHKATQTAAPIASQHAKGGVGKKTLVLFLVDSQDHDSEIDPWPWGGPREAPGSPPRKHFSSILVQFWDILSINFGAFLALLGHR